MKFKEFQQLTRRTLPQLHDVYHTIQPSGQGQAGDITSVKNLAFFVPAKSSKDTAGYPIEITAKFIPLPQILNLIHMNLGIVSEINELMDAIDKEDSVNIAEELADQLWYCANDLTISLKAGIIDTGTFEHFSKYEFGTTQSTDGGVVKIKDNYWLAANIYNSSKLCNLNKRFMAYGKFPDTLDYTKTMRYLLASINNLAVAYKINLELAMSNVIEKLKVRFPDKFDAAAAVTRDLTQERKALEVTDESKNTQLEPPIQ